MTGPLDEPLVLPADPDLPVPYTVVDTSSGWHRPDVEAAAIEYLSQVIAPASARQIVDGLLAKGRTQDTAAKDTPRGESTLSSDVLDLLTAIRDAIDVPRAVLTYADEQARADLLHQRTVSARIALNSIIDRGADLPGVVERLTERTADTPVDYTVWVPTQDGGGQA